MSPSELTPDQRQKIHELQEEVRALDVQADALWSKYLRTRDEECFEQVLALESEAEMKALIAYMPKAGERRINKVRSLIDSIRGQHRNLEPMYEARIDTLRSINAWRESIGLPPLDRLPVGITGDATECTIARALSTGWEGSGMEPVQWEVSGERQYYVEYRDRDGYIREVDLTEWASGWDEVISSFDNGDYPDLLDSETLVERAAQEIAGNGVERMDASDWMMLAESAITQRGLQRELLSELRTTHEIIAEWRDGHLHVVGYGVTSG